MQLRFERNQEDHFQELQGVGTGYFHWAFRDVIKNGLLTQSPVSRNRIFTVVMHKEPSGAYPQNSIFGCITLVKGR